MDTVVGTAVLGTRTLWLVYEATGPSPFDNVVKTRRRNARITVYQKGEPKPEAIAWEYTIEGDVLNITPSLHIQYEVGGQLKTEFHNQYSWSVKFQRLPEGETGYQLCHKLNCNPETGQL